MNNESLSNRYDVLRQSAMEKIRNEFSPARSRDYQHCFKSYRKWSKHIDATRIIIFYDWLSILLIILSESIFLSWSSS